jgi:hypothetical protein
LEETLPPGVLDGRTIEEVVMKVIGLPLALAAALFVSAPTAAAIPPEEMPELRLASASASYQGTHWRVTVGVENRSRIAAGGFRVALRRGSQPLGSVVFPGVGALQRASRSFDQPLVADAQGRLCALRADVIVDADGAVAEGNETDNTGRVSAAVDRCAVCPRRIGVPTGSAVISMPYCADRSLTLPDASLRRAVIAIRGADQHADVAHDAVTAAAAAAGVGDLLVIAPHFLEEPELVDLGDPPGVPFWSGGWREGDRSRSTLAHPRSATVSSFAVVDAILRRLADRSAFPNLERVVVAGHSAGGQFVNRYAAGTRVVQELHAAGIDVVRFAIANPSTYLYLNPERPVPAGMQQVSTTRFAVPSAARRAACPAYDDYKHGLRNLNSYMAAVGATAIRAQYRQRSVSYLLGALDNDPNAAGLSMGCEANLQGFQRLERGTAYFNHLECAYGGTSVYATHKLSVVPGVGHSSVGMFGSLAGRQALFGGGLPAPLPAPDCGVIAAG